MILDDASILALYFKRDERAIARTDEKYGPSCRKVARRILWDGRDIDECISDTWLRAWNVIPPKRPDPLEAFLNRVTRNLSINRHDYNKAQKRDSALTVAFMELNDGLPDPKETVTDEMAFRDFINRFLRSQSREARRYFLLRYWYGMTIQEIAQKCQANEEKVKSSLFRTRNKLREAMEKENIQV